MTWVVKVAGMVLLFISCTLAGFCKARGIERRVRLLCEIYTSLDTLKERIRYNGGELSSLLEASFSGCAVIEVCGDSARVSGGGLSGEDAQVLEEFFSLLGASGCESECSRIELYQSLLAKQRREAEQDAAQFPRLWRTGGFCAGLLGCIFFL